MVVRPLHLVEEPQLVVLMLLLLLLLLLLLTMASPAVAVLRLAMLSLTRLEGERGDWVRRRKG